MYVETIFCCKRHKYSLPRRRFQGELVGRDERRTPLKTPVWEAIINTENSCLVPSVARLLFLAAPHLALGSLWTWQQRLNILIYFFSH